MQGLLKRGLDGSHLFNEQQRREFARAASPRQELVGRVRRCIGGVLDADAVEGSALFLARGAGEDVGRTGEGCREKSNFCGEGQAEMPKCSNRRGAEMVHFDVLDFPINIPLTLPLVEALNG